MALFFNANFKKGIDKMKNKTKKIMAIILLVLTLCSSLPISSFATFITDINSNATFGVISGSLSAYGHELHYAN